MINLLDIYLERAEQSAEYAYALPMMLRFNLFEQKHQDYAKPRVLAYSWDDIGVATQFILNDHYSRILADEFDAIALEVQRDQQPIIHAFGNLMKSDENRQAANFTLCVNAVEQQLIDQLYARYPDGSNDFYILPPLFKRTYSADGLLHATELNTHAAVGLKAQNGSWRIGVRGMITPEESHQTDIDTLMDQLIGSGSPKQP